MEMVYLIVSFSTYQAYSFQGYIFSVCAIFVIRNRKSEIHEIAYACLYHKIRDFNKGIHDCPW